MGGLALKSQMLRFWPATVYLALAKEGRCFQPSSAADQGQLSRQSMIPMWRFRAEAGIIPPKGEDNCQLQLWLFLFSSLVQFLGSPCSPPPRLSGFGKRSSYFMRCKI